MSILSLSFANKGAHDEHEITLALDKKRVYTIAGMFYATLLQLLLDFWHSEIVENDMDNLRQRRWSIGLIVITLIVTSIFVVTVIPSLLHHNSTAPSTLILPNAGTDKVIVNTYTDDDNGFQVNHPLAWQSIALNPGIEFDDNSKNPATIVQILLPGTAQNQDTDWVSYEMDQLRQTVNTSGFQQSNGIAQITMGGTTWKGQQAAFTLATQQVTVQVFATVYHNRVYIMNWWTTTIPMDTARTRWFDSIAQSFSFLS